MRMRGMPSICVTAQRVCGARAANIRLVESFFRNAREKVEAAFDISMTRRLVALLDCRKVSRIALRFGLASRFSCGGEAAYDRDRWSLSILKTRVLF